MKKIQFIAQIILSSLFLTACGGGGGGGGTTTPPTPVNVAPTANAGVDQAVLEFETVGMLGSGADTDGTIASYSWEQISGEAATLMNSNTMTASFEAPSTDGEVAKALLFQLTVTDNDGAIGTDTVVIGIETTNMFPDANAGADQTEDEQTLVSLDGSASEDVDGSISSYEWLQLEGTDVSLTDPSIANPTFTTPSLSFSEALIFQLTVADDRGFENVDTVTITVNPVAGLNEAPLADAGPAQTVASEATVTLDGSLSTDSDGTIVSHAWAQLSGSPTVSLTNADMASATFTAPTVTTNTVLSFTVTVTDNEGAIADDFVEITITPAPSTVIISGKATYDNVPHNSITNGLNYLLTTKDPIRSALVELISGTSIVDSGITDLNGNYSFEVDPNSGTYFVRVKSRSLSSGTANWDVLVVDNTNLDTVTNEQLLYALDGSSFTVGTADISRPTMNATTTWNGSSYTNISGAPFHILDRIVDGNLKLQSVDADVNLPAVDVNWSVNNTPTSGTATDDLDNFRNGDIGTSFYSTFPTNAAEFSGPQFFILGAANVDTDEYDGHVVVHEWGHYFEANLSRSDSIGGAHTGGDRLDMRLAFGEGFGNAWSAIISDDQYYRDSGGNDQASGFSLNMESNVASNEGWYSEGSVMSILYDIYDSANDGSDTTSLGLAPIYEVLVGPQIDTEAFTSIFSFITFLKDSNATAVSGIDALLSNQSINGTGIWGAGESNSAGASPSTDVLPVYTELTVGGAAKEVCSIDDYDPTNTGNKLSNFRFVRFNIPTAGNYTFLVSAGATQDSDMAIYKNGEYTGFFAAPGGDGDPGDAGDSTFAMTAGNYTAEAFEFDNTFNSPDVDTKSSDECFTVQIVSAP